VPDYRKCNSVNSGRQEEYFTYAEGPDYKSGVTDCQEVAVECKLDQK